MADDNGYKRLGEKGDPCHCEDCDPELHEDCSADCLVYDCWCIYACCNSECDK